MRFSLLLSFSYHIYVVYPYQKHTGHVSKLHFKVPKESGKSLTQHSSAAQQDTVHLKQMSHERLFLVGMGTFIINKFIDILHSKNLRCIMHLVRVIVIQVVLVRQLRDPCISR